MFILRFISLTCIDRSGGKSPAMALAGPIESKIEPIKNRLTFTYYFKLSTTIRTLTQHKPIHFKVLTPYTHFSRAENKVPHTYRQIETICNLIKFTSSELTIYINLMTQN